MVAARNIAISLAAFVVLLAPAAASATEPQIAHGTFDFAVVAVTSVQPADGNLLITQTLRGSLAGDASGSVDEAEQLVVHPTGEIGFRGTDVCSCTVAGRSGTLTDRIEGQVAADGQLTGTVRSISANGGLTGLHFEGDIAGPTTGPNAGTYTIRLHFDPA
jgi:Protein of unknown function (DUF3224)